MLSHRTFNITLRISFNITLIIVFSQVNYFTQYPVKGVYGNLFNNNTIYIYHAPIATGVLGCCHRARCYTRCVDNYAIMDSCV